ncbi:AAA family ATPase [Flavobacterium subsaxonicum]|uniref:ATPase AAA-type core domain-containing protein n=1 Tax=Flavobacterium subsaxonicum WB 4.1-42 = DSM 21790 TaxID=1121898 RepID=A0A0A2MRZ2_9FLAO|nr:AAA family ATPase [Flavobacterium subsaxonicum]KGO91025.1 hypothetical protein Q766_20270 [Flavobacterium subsaxonicum WB 4.1-42 = DSM 21790]
MRIIELHIKSPWKNLDGFSVTFNSSNDIAVLLGKNGSAKSNLLETIIKIFRDIDLRYPSPFAYSMTYTINGCKVNIETEKGKQAKAKVDGVTVSFLELKASWVPRYIVGYYSGASDRFDELFQIHDKNALKSTLHPIKPGEKLSFRTFILARPVHGLFALLSFYLSHDKEIVSFLESYPRIEGFDSALITIKKPTWAKKGSTADDFWGAKGPVGDLLNSILKHSMAPFTRTVTVNTDFRRRERRELTFLHLPDLSSLHDLSAEYGSDPRAFFQALDTMRLSDLLEDFKVRVKVKGANSAIHTRQLSEGEQQLLTVLGLMRFTQDAGSLYILDEPDTHLNPAWGLDYLERLRIIGGINKDSHTIIATHDPLLVAGLLKEEIKVLSRSEAGKITATEPEESPRGTGVAGVLTSELYGLESQLDRFSLKVLKRIYEVSMLENYPAKNKHLHRLRKIVPGLNATDISPDPYRNIAKLAYKEAIELVINSESNSEVKIKAIENLSALLYNAAKKI